MNWNYRWSPVAILPLALITVVGLLRIHNTIPVRGAEITTQSGQSVTIRVAPGRADAENTITIVGIPASVVRILSRSLDMNMDNIYYMARTLGDG